ncbi:MAG TPA: hypothetical protein VK211_04505, partial [Kamptonema sp.]|nr:hypothetical protein [Kamptonema sp.]
MKVGVADNLFAGGGEMGALMRSHDWSTTPLGAVTEWPQSLRTALSICLNSRFPMVIWWGPQLVLLYNDAWRPVLGNKHPQALGRAGCEVWGEIWDIIGVQLNTVLATGQATWSDDLLLIVERYGYREEAYFTYSYSPIWDEEGKVGGAFTAVNETTGRVLGERRLATLRDLVDQASQAKTEEEACATAIETIANNPADIPFALLYLLSEGADRALLCGSTPLEAGTVASPSCVDLITVTNNINNRQDACSRNSEFSSGGGILPAREKFINSDAIGEVELTVATSVEAGFIELEQPYNSGWPLAAAVETGQPVVVENLLSRFGPLPSGVWDIPPQQAVILPIWAVGQERPAGLLIAG